MTNETIKEKYDAFVEHVREYGEFDPKLVKYVFSFIENEVIPEIRREDELLLDSFIEDVEACALLASGNDQKNLIRAIKNARENKKKFYPPNTTIV